MGQSYLLASPEDGASRLLDAVERVDTAMCKIRDAGKVRARDRIAVLAALNLAFDLADRNAVAKEALVAASSQGSHLPDAINTTETADSPVLAALLQRLDATLSGDGQLI